MPPAPAQVQGRRRPRVAIVGAWIPQYRREFYEGLRSRLAAQGVALAVVAGEAFGGQAHKDDSIDLPWVHTVPSRTVPVGTRTLSWRPVASLVAGADLVIAPQKTAHMENYHFLVRQWTGRQRFAFWGHGRNFQNASPVAEAVKRAVSTSVHWWFAYNELSAAVVADLGYPRERITVVNNAIDTRRLQHWADAVGEADLARARSELGLGDGPVGLFVGGLYAEKRLDYLVQAGDRLRALVPGFQLLVVGSGPDAAVVDRAAEDRPWLRPLGPRFDEEKARLLRLADVLLMPGLVGLVILDAFAVGLPLVTLADSQHSPEIDYLRNGVNGLMLPAGTTPAEYARRVAVLLSDDAEHRRLATGARADASRYSVEQMVERFAGGIDRALRAERHRW